MSCDACMLTWCRSFSWHFGKTESLFVDRVSPHCTCAHICTLYCTMKMSLLFLLLFLYSNVITMESVSLSFLAYYLDFGDKQHTA
uniref:Uncharacterized protein n=1 Tax=Aegilops tauschii subsp. strangulata TaxID=200361 RepID=A0A453BFT9_AEGTS